MAPTNIRIHGRCPRPGAYGGEILQAVAEPKCVTSYIVRIYRRDPTGADEVAGIAEIPEQGAQVAFRSFNELRAILARDVLDEATATGNATASKSKRKTSRRGV